MVFVRLAKAFLLLELSLLLCTPFIVYGGEVDCLPSEPPVKLPVKPPTEPCDKPPVKPPTDPCDKPPVTPPSKAVAVQGMVYCKSCKYRGVDTVKGGSPLAGAMVNLVCSNTKHTLVEGTKTDKNGYFFFMPPKLTTDEAHKCRVYLVSSPLYKCSVPTNTNSGKAGAVLTSAKNQPIEKTKKPVKLFTVGPFAFEPLEKLCLYC